MIKSTASSIWRGYSNYVAGIVMPTSNSDVKDINYLRNVIFCNILTYLVPLSVIALVPSSYAVFHTGLTVLGIVDALAFLSLALLLVVPQLTLKSRKIIFLCVGYGLSFTLLYYVSNTGSGMLFLLTLTILTAVIYSSSAAYYSAIVNTALCFIFAFSIYLGIKAPALADHSIITWLAASSNLVLLSFVCAQSQGFLLEGLEAAMAGKISQQEKLDKANRLNAFISAINQSIVHIKDKQELFDRACSIAVNIGQFKMAWIGLLDESSSVNIVSFNGEGDVAKRLLQFSGLDLNNPAFCEIPTFKALQTRKCVFSNDVQNDPAFKAWKNEFEKQGIAASISLPIFTMGKVVGVLGLHATNKNIFDEQEIALLEEATGDISFALEILEKDKQHTEIEEQIVKNEQRFRALIEKSDEMTTLSDETGKLLYASPSIENVFGFKIEELIDKPAFQFMHPDEVSRLLEQRKELLKTPGNSVYIQQRLMDKQGNWIWCEGTATNRFADPDIKAMVVNFRDVSERVNLEKQKEFDDNNFTALINNTNDLMWSVDTNFNLLTSNEPFNKAMEYSIGHVLEKGSPILAVATSAEQSNRFKSCYMRAMAGEYLTEMEHIESPIESWAEVSYQPIKKMNEVVGISCHWHDITERKKAQTLLEANRNEMELLLNNTEESFILLDLELNMISFNKLANDRALELIGAPLYKGMSIFRLADSARIPELKTMYEKILKGETMETKLRTKLKGDIELCFNNKIKPVYGSNKETTGVFIITADITEKERTNAQLIENYNELQAATETQSSILDGLPANIALLNKEGEIIAVNEAWKKFGSANGLCSKNQCVGDNYLVTAERAAGNEAEDGYKISEGIRQVISGVLQNFEMEYPCNSPDEQRWFRVKVAPLMKAGRTGAVVLHINITEKKIAQDKINNMNEHLEERVNERTADLTEANKALEAFSSTVSHDLRAPLRAINGFAKIIKSQHGANMPADEKELFGYIEDSGKRMGEIIDDLLKLAKYGKEKLKPETVDMNRLIRGIWLNISRSTIHHATLELADVQDVMVDMSMIQQVVVNLLTNAIKYSSKKPNPVVTVWSEQTEGLITFYFKDNGAGFDMSNYHKLFGAFQRLHSNREFEGTGVGLTLVKRIIEKHGGTVGAEGKVDEGATFYFSIPTNNADDERVLNTNLSIEAV